MRVALDTNVLVSALLTEHGAPARLLDAWRIGRRFVLVTCEEQLAELNEVTRRPGLRAYVTASNAGRFVNELRQLADVCSGLPQVQRSIDPADDFLLAMAEAGRVDYLVSGDKRGVLALGSHGSTRIVTARAFLEFLQQGI